MNFIPTLSALVHVKFTRQTSDKISMRTLIVCLMFALTACNDSGSSAQTESVSKDPFFKEWNTDGTTITLALDFSASDYGTSTVKTTSPTAVCSCVAVINGDAASGSADLDACTLVSGNPSDCDGTPGVWGTINYSTTAGAISAELVAPAVTTPFPLH